MGQLELDVSRAGSPITTTTDRHSRVPRISFMLPASLILAVVTITGLPYYVLPVSERVRNELHAWLKPTGYVGQSAGIVAFILFMFLWLYPLRKRFRWLSFTGSVGRWLDTHILAGLLIPWLAAVHAGWRFDGLIGLGFGAMLLVCLSGIAGKYIYARIPRGKTGLEMSLGEIEKKMARLELRLAGVSGANLEEVRRTIRSLGEQTGQRGIIRAMVADDIARWRAVRDLKRQWISERPTDWKQGKKTLSEVMGLVRRRIALDQQVRMLDGTNRIFRFWHAAHKPVAVTSLLAVLLHVLVAVILGVTWFR